MTMKLMVGSALVLTSILGAYSASADTVTVVRTESSTRGIINGGPVGTASRLFTDLKEGRLKSNSLIGVREVLGQFVSGTRLVDERGNESANTVVFESSVAEDISKDRSGALIIKGTPAQELISTLATGQLEVDRLGPDEKNDYHFRSATCNADPNDPRQRVTCTISP